MNDHNEEIQNVITRTLNTAFDVIDQKLVHELIKLVVSHIFPKIRTFFDTTDVCKMDSIRKQISDEILMSVSDVNTELRNIAIELLNTGKLSTSVCTIGELLKENNRDYVDEPIINIQQFYKLLVNVCIKTMDEADEYVQKIDTIFGKIYNELVNIQNDPTMKIILDKNTTLMPNVGLYIRKITEPATIAVIECFSTKIVVLSQAMHIFYNDMSKVTSLIKLNMRHHYAKYFTDFEKEFDRKNCLLSNYNGINICIDDKGEFINTSNIGVAVGNAHLMTKFTIFESLIFNRGCTDDNIRHWVYAHEIGHILQKSNSIIRRDYVSKINTSDSYRTLRILSSFEHEKNEYDADRYAYNLYGKDISVQALEWLGITDASLSGKPFMIVMDEQDPNGIYPSLNDRINKIESYTNNAQIIKDITIG